MSKKKNRLEIIAPVEANSIYMLEKPGCTCPPPRKCYVSVVLEGDLRPYAFESLDDALDVQKICTEKYGIKPEYVRFGIADIPEQLLAYKRAGSEEYRLIAKVSTG